MIYTYTHWAGSLIRSASSMISGASCARGSSGIPVRSTDACVFWNDWSGVCCVLRQLLAPSGCVFGAQHTVALPDSWSRETGKGSQWVKNSHMITWYITWCSLYKRQQTLKKVVCYDQFNPEMINNFMFVEKVTQNSQLDIIDNNYVRGSCVFRIQKHVICESISDRF